MFLFNLSRMATREQALEHLQKHAGLRADEAEQLLDAVVEAASAEAIDAIADDDPPPTAVGDIRADRVARICRGVGRLLRPVEIEAVLRMPPSGSKAVLTRVRARYPRFADEWERELIRAQSIPPTNVGTLGNPQWKVAFRDPVVLDYALERLNREAMTRNVKRDPIEQSLSFPPKISDRQNVERSVFEVLGLDEPRRGRGR